MEREKNVHGNMHTHNTQPMQTLQKTTQKLQKKTTNKKLPQHTHKRVQRMQPQRGMRPNHILHRIPKTTTTKTGTIRTTPTIKIPRSRQDTILSNQNNDRKKRQQ